MSIQKSFIFTEIIGSCTECKHHLVRQIYTPDPFECELGIYCTEVEDQKDSYERHTVGGGTNYRLVVADDHDPGRYATIPDWCPFLQPE